jgi:4-amino-4-deoxy-L-arabinose transferase-like glycosyltransferase
MVSRVTFDDLVRPSRGAALMRLARRLAPPLLILAAAALLLATAPVADDFSWSDAPRHALNGIFVRDFVAAHPWHDPTGWAQSYYLKYPALSVLFYPPLFYVVEAAFYAAFGFSHFVAQLTVAAFYALLGLATYRLARLWLSRYVSLGVALMLMGAPTMAFWGRQVMLDIPADALMSLGAYFVLRFIKDDRGRDLALGVGLTLAAIYTKYNVAFIVPVLGLALLAARGSAVLKDRRIWLACALAALALIPAAWLNLHYGAANIQSASDLAGELPRDSLAAWLFYPAALPEMLSWPVLVLALVGSALVARERGGALRGWPLVLLLTWIAVGYLAFSAISLRAPRHVLPVLTPLVILAGYALQRLAPARWAGLAACAFGVATLGMTLYTDPVPVITGHKAIADAVADMAPPNAVVLFSGYRDGNFIFAIRARQDRPDISVLRADKLLLRIVVERNRGVAEAGYSEDDIAKLIRDLGVDIVVAEDGFWDDLTEMQRFEAVLARPDFAPIGHFPITGTMGHSDKSFTLYRPTYAVSHPRGSLSIDMPIIGETFHGPAR